MIINKENFDFDTVKAINDTLKEYKLEWAINTSEDESVLQIIIYNYKQNMYITDLVDIEDELCDVICKTLGFSVFMSYIQFNTGNIIFEYRDSLYDNQEVFNKEYCQFN